MLYFIHANGKLHFQSRTFKNVIGILRKIIICFLQAYNACYYHRSKISVNIKTEVLCQTYIFGIEKLLKKEKPYCYILMLCKFSGPHERYIPDDSRANG